MHKFALFAGSAAAAIFMISQLPMLTKAWRTKDLTSYSFANIGLANVGNLLYALYVVQVPVGPVWAIHGFNLTTSGLMLFWYLRYGWRRRATSRGAALSEPRDRSGDLSAADAAPTRANNERLRGSVRSSPPARAHPAGHDFGNPEASSRRVEEPAPGGCRTAAIVRRHGSPTHASEGTGRCKRRQAQ